MLLKNRLQKLEQHAASIPRPLTREEMTARILQLVREKNISAERWQELLAEARRRIEARQRA